MFYFKFCAFYPKIKSLIHFLDFSFFDVAFFIGDSFFLGDWLFFGDSLKADRLLAQAYATMPIERVVLELIQPTLVEVGERWQGVHG